MKAPDYLVVTPRFCQRNVSSKFIPRVTEEVSVLVVILVVRTVSAPDDGQLDELLLLVLVVSWLQQLADNLHGRQELVLAAASRRSGRRDQHMQRLLEMFPAGLATKTLLLQRTLDRAVTTNHDGAIGFGFELLHTETLRAENPEEAAMYCRE